MQRKTARLATPDVADGSVCDVGSSGPCGGRCVKQNLHKIFSVGLTLHAIRPHANPQEYLRRSANEQNIDMPQYDADDADQVC